MAVVLSEADLKGAFALGERTVGFVGYVPWSAPCSVTKTVPM